MQTLRWFSLAIILLVPVFAFGQNDSDAAAKAVKEKQLKLDSIVDQILADIPNFRLGSNRAFLYAKAGSLICKADPTRGVDLLRTSIGELINAQMLAETERKTNQPNELLTSQTTRPQVLNTIAICDAEFALQSFYTTRPPLVEKALSAVPEKSSKISNNPGSNPYLTQNEINLEQTLMRIAADQNPDRAIALLKESLKRGLSGETFNLLQKLNAKDPDEANRLAADVVGNLIQKGFATSGQSNPSNIYLATTVLTEFIRVKGDTEKALKFVDSQMRELAEKIFTSYLDQTNNSGYFSSQSLIPIAEKLSAGYVGKLKAQEKKINTRNGGFGRNVDPGVSTLLSSNPTAEKLIAEAKNFPLDSRRQIYSTAANKLADVDNLAAANALLNENFSDDALVIARESLNWYYAHRLMNLGKYAEAESMMSDFPESNRNAALINLALAMYNKDKVENREPAISILDKVRMQMLLRPANQNEMSQLMQLVSAYSKLDSPEGFRLIESIIPQINELSEASILVSSFQGGWNMQQGEFLVGQGMPFGFYFDTSILRTLADKNFDRAMRLLDGFTRKEMRVSLVMGLADNIANQR